MKKLLIISVLAFLFFGTGNVFAGGWSTADMFLTVDLSAADIKAMYATPVTVIAAPGAGKVIAVDEVVYSFTYGGTQFTGGGTVILAWETTPTIELGGYLESALMKGAANFISCVTGRSHNSKANNAVVIRNATAAFATGNSTMKLFIKYRIISLTGENPGGAVVWGEITGTLSDQTDLQTALNNLNMDKYFQLVSNTSTGAEFYLEKTMSYGQALIIFFFTLFTISFICLVIWRFFWKK